MNNPSPESYSPASARLFREILGEAQASSPLVAQMTVPVAQLVLGPLDRCYVSNDEQSGFVVRANGEQVAGFSLVRGRGDHMLRCAIKLGGTHMDCFDGRLVPWHEKAGFVVVRRELNWTPGGPDVVFMALPGSQAYMDAVEHSYENDAQA